MKKRIGLLAYGETGSAALRGLMNRFEVLWIIVPPEELQREVQKSKGVEDLARSINVRVVKTNSSQEIEKLIRESQPLAVVISSYNKILPAKILSQSKFINIKEDERREIKALEILVPSYRQARQGFPPNYVLVMESERMHTTTETRRQTGKALDIKNTITLYDKTGNVLFQKTNLECFPVALSANSGISACLTMPVEGEDWVFTETEKDALKDKVLVFSKHGEVVREIIEPINQVQNVKISPSGNWLAYVKQLERLSNQVVLINLNTGKKVALPVTDDRTVMYYEEVLDNGDLMGYEEIPHKGSSGRWESVPQPKILYKMGP